MRAGISLSLVLAALSGCSRKAPAGAAAHPKMCEVEISGQVKLPKDVVNVPVPMTFVAVGDCLAPDPKIIGFGGTTSGKFFIEVFASWGSDLTICAASEPAPGQPSQLYGKASIAIHAEKSGENEFRDVIVELAPGPPRRFPHNNTPR